MEIVHKPTDLFIKMQDAYHRSSDSPIVRFVLTKEESDHFLENVSPQIDCGNVTRHDSKSHIWMFEYCYKGIPVEFHKDITSQL